MEVNYAVEGLKFMLLGMGTVFSFLLLLVYILKFQEGLFKKFFPEKSSGAKSKSPVVSTKTDNDDEVVAVITAAVADFKKRK